MGNGNQLCIKNNKYQITVEPEDNDKTLALKVKDRNNFENDNYIQYKRYKYFKLPVEIKA
jgi:hypothetical protein